jgi:hypothetical protein
MLLSGPGNAFAGESVYKVWTQELFPTLLRATATGVTMAFTRAVAGLAALGTPAFALSHTRLFFGLLFGFMLLAAVIGLAWVPRPPKAPGFGQKPVSTAEPSPLAARRSPTPSRPSRPPQPPDSSACSQRSGAVVDVALDAVAATTTSPGPRRKPAITAAPYPP